MVTLKAHWRLLLTAGAVAAALMVGCSADKPDDTNPEAYFKQLADSQRRAASIEIPDGCENLDPVFGLDFEGTWDEYREESIRFSNCLQAIGEASVHYLDGIEPPADLTAEHERYVAAQRRFWEQEGERIAKIRSADSEVEFLSISSDMDWALWQEQDSSCRALQRAADDRGIEIDLGCNEE